MNRKRKESNASSPPKRKKVRLSKKAPKRKKKKGNLKEDSDYNDSSDSSTQGSTQDQNIITENDHFSQMKTGHEDIDDDSVNKNLEEPACDANPIMSLNVIMVCKKNFLSENKPREDNSIIHYQEIKELNEHSLDWNCVSTTDAHDFRLFCATL